MKSKKLSIFPFATVLFTCFLLSCKSSGHKNINEYSSIKSFELPPPARLNSNIAGEINTACNQWYDSIFPHNNFNGGILVSKNGNIVFEKYNGITNPGTNEAITSKTAFHIASVSKTFTAMCVLKLWQDKKINIDDEFSVYFPEFNYPGVTIKTLLNHRSGLPNYVYFMDELGWNRNTFISNKDVLDCLIKYKNQLKNINKPNKSFAYCNTNYALLALLIEKISSMTYPEFLKKNVFEPLGMSDSYVFTQADSAISLPSYDWRGQREAFTNLDYVYGDKNIYSTPEDLLKWDRLLSTEQFLLKQTLNAAYAPYSNERPGIRNYGLGWRMNIFPNGKKMIYHNGWWHGNNAAFIRLIDEDATIIVLGNQYNRGIYKAKLLTKIFSHAYTTNEDEE